MSKLDDSISKLIGKALIDPETNSDLAIKTIEYDPKGMPNSQRALDQAQRESLEVVYPADNELMIDIDNEHSYMLFQNQIQIVSKFVGVVEVRENPSKSGKPWKMHITVELDPNVSMLERLALQAMLGSDRTRELLGYVQYKNNDPHPVLFLEKKPAMLSAAPEPAGLLSENVLSDEEITY